MNRNALYLILLLLTLSGCLENKPRKPIASKTTSYIKTSVALNKQLNLEEESQLKQYIKKDTLHNYIASSNGFWYAYLHKSNATQKPQKYDIVQYTASILNLENDTLYTAKHLGTQQYVIDKQDIIEGLGKGLKLMKEKDEIKFLFPSYLAYGYLGDKDKINIKQPLIYKVKLQKIIKKNE